MTTVPGLRSPPPIRAPSPNLPRPSTSSNRSFRRTGADFEAALLDPTATMFLSGSPVLDQEGFQSSPPRKVDHDAPQPVEKRSFEEDLMVAAVTPAKKVGVIPPTPSTFASDKRSSRTDLVPVRMPSGSRKTGQSFGIDGE